MGVGALEGESHQTEIGAVGIPSLDYEIGMSHSVVHKLHMEALDKTGHLPAGWGGTCNTPGGLTDSVALLVANEVALTQRREPIPTPYNARPAG